MEKAIERANAALKKVTDRIPEHLSGGVEIDLEFLPLPAQPHVYSVYVIQCDRLCVDRKEIEMNGDDERLRKLVQIRLENILWQIKENCKDIQDALRATESDTPSADET